MQSSHTLLQSDQNFRNTFAFKESLLILSVPLLQALKPSNHATIQSIVRAVGVVPGIPEPCCVPEKMSSLSILFFDEDKNVVLKVYPNMTVDSCACRQFFFSSMPVHIKLMSFIKVKKKNQHMQPERHSLLLFLQSNTHSLTNTHRTQRTVALEESASCCSR